MRTPNLAFLSVAFEKLAAAGTVSPAVRETIIHITQRVLQEPPESLQVSLTVQTLDPDRFHCYATFRTRQSCNLAITLPYACKSGPKWILAVLEMVEQSVRNIEVALELDWDTGVEKEDGLDTDVVQLLGQLPHVNSLSVCGCWAYELAGMMSEPTEGGDGPRWLFAELEEFVLEDGVGLEADFQDFLDMVRRRYGYDASGAYSRPIKPDLPRRWKRLELPQWARDQPGRINEIRRITGLDPFCL